MQCSVLFFNFSGSFIIIFISGTVDYKSLRKMAADFMEAHPEIFSAFVKGDKLQVAVHCIGFFLKFNFSCFTYVPHFHSGALSSHQGYF